jgi:hypothetical protein
MTHRIGHAATPTAAPAITPRAPETAPAQQAQRPAASGHPVRDFVDRMVYSKPVELATGFTFVGASMMALSAPWWLNAIPAVGTTGEAVMSAVVAVTAGVAFGHVAAERERRAQS